MNKRLFVLCIAMIAIWGSAHAEEFYFGAQGNQNITYDSMTISELRSMRDTLGFNVYSALSAWPSMLDMMDDYLKLIPDMNTARGERLPAFADYSAAHYAKVEAEDDDMYQIRFRGTRVVENGYAIAPYDPDTSYEEVYLDSLWYKHRTSIYTYGIQVRAVDGGTAPGDTMAYGDTIGFIKIWTGNWWNDLPVTLIETYYIEADTFLNASSDTLYLEFGPIYREGLDYIQIGTNNACSLGVDYLKIFNEKGFSLIEDPTNLWADSMVAFAQANSQYVLNWHLQDEPPFLEWEPYRIIANALASCSSCSTATSTFNVHVNQSPKDFINKADPAFLWPDIYPLHGGQFVEKTLYYPESTVVKTHNNSNMVFYTGSNGPPIWYTPQDRGIQYNLDNRYIREMDSLYSASVSLGKDLWLFPQGFGGRHISHWDYDPENPDIDSIYYDADSGWMWRPPTESELSCVTFLGMCYPLKGLTYWRYDSYGNNPNGLSEYHMRGIIDTGLVRTELWYAIKNNIGPYINAIGDLFVTLDYNTSYTVHHGTPSFDPPPGAWLDSIRAVSNSPDSNPDLGWFHVGQFTEGGDKYVMIVNRACSQDTLNPAPAPSITATIKFDAGALNLGNYVYVIDIATGTDSSDWDGTPDTTYSGKMPDGTIPFTTVLGPGEGRLFKIVQTSQKVLSGNIATQYNYQGRIKVSSDITVPADSTMKIYGTGAI